MVIIKLTRYPFCWKWTGPKKNSFGINGVSICGTRSFKFAICIKLLYVGFAQRLLMLKSADQRGSYNHLSYLNDL